MSKAKPSAATAQVSHWTAVSGGGALSTAGGVLVTPASKRNEAREVNGVHTRETEVRAGHGRRCYSARAPAVAVASIASTPFQERRSTWEARDSPIPWAGSCRFSP